MLFYQISPFLQTTMPVLFIQPACLPNKHSDRRLCCDNRLSQLDKLLIATTRICICILNVRRGLSGGHGFEVIEDVETVEVKQGPFSGDNDKTRFTNKG